MTQLGLFDAPLSLIDTERGSVTYRACFLPAATADALFAALRDGVVVGVAGVRPMELLYCGRILQIDDLVVSQTERSGGVGKALLDHIKAEARALGRSEVHLDSALILHDAHRFYAREGFERLGYHFRCRL